MAVGAWPKALRDLVHAGSRLALAARWRMRGYSTPLVTSSGSADCGPACVAMVLAAHEAARPFGEILRQRACGPAMSMAELVELASVWGLDGRGLRLSDNTLDRLPLPAILHWNDNHFIVLDSLDGRLARVVDPAVGAYDVTREELLARSSKAVTFATGAGAFPGGGHTRPSFDWTIVLLSSLAGLCLATLPLQIAALVSRGSERPEALWGMIATLVAWGVANWRTMDRRKRLARERLAKFEQHLLTALPFPAPSSDNDVEQMLRRLLWRGREAIQTGLNDLGATWSSLSVLLASIVVVASRPEHWGVGVLALLLGCGLALGASSPPRAAWENLPPPLDPQLSLSAWRGRVLWTLRGDGSWRGWAASSGAAALAHGLDRQRSAIGPLSVAAVLALLALAFGRGLDWGLAGSLILIVGGAKLFFQPPHERSPPLILGEDRAAAVEWSQLVATSANGSSEVIRVRRGELVAVCGGSAIKRSSAARALTGAAYGSEWRVTCDGVAPDTRPWRVGGPGYYHAHLADQIYPGGLIDNITLFDPAPDGVRVARLVEHLRLEEAVLARSRPGVLPHAAVSEPSARLMLARGLYLGEAFLVVDSLLDVLSAEMRAEAIKLLKAAPGTRIVCSGLEADALDIKPVNILQTGLNGRLKQNHG